MDQELKQELGKLQQNLKEGFGEQFKEVNKRIDNMSEFMMTHVALKIDLQDIRQDMATKDDLRNLKSDIFSKVDGIAHYYQKLDDEKLATDRRLGILEQKLGIV